MRRYQGRGKSALVIDGGDIVIEHDTTTAPDRRVNQSQVTAAHFEPATRFTAGIITISIDGADLYIPKGRDVGSDPFTVLFKYRSNSTFEQLYNWLVRLASSNGR